MKYDHDLNLQHYTCFFLIICDLAMVAYNVKQRLWGLAAATLLWVPNMCYLLYSTRAQQETRDLARKAIESHRKAMDALAKKIEEADGPSAWLN